MPMAMQFVTKNTDKPNKPIEMTRRNQILEYFNICYEAVADLKKKQEQC